MLIKKNILKLVGSTILIGRHVLNTVVDLSPDYLNQKDLLKTFNRDFFSPTSSRTKLRFALSVITYFLQTPKLILKYFAGRDESGQNENFVGIDIINHQIQRILLNQIDNIFSVLNKSLRLIKFYFNKKFNKKFNKDLHKKYSNHLINKIWNNKFIIPFFTGILDNCINNFTTMLKVEGTRTIRLTNFLLLAERYNFKNLISDPINLFKSSNISTGLSSGITDNNKIIYEAPNTSNDNKFERFKNWIKQFMVPTNPPITGNGWTDLVLSYIWSPIIKAIKNYIGDIDKTIDELSYDVKSSGDLVMKGENTHLIIIINIIYRYYNEIIENNPKINPDTSKLGLLLGNYDDSNILYRKNLEYDDIEGILKGVLYRYVPDISNKSLSDIKKEIRGKIKEIIRNENIDEFILIDFIEGEYDSEENRIKTFDEVEKTQIKDYTEEYMAGAISQLEFKKYFDPKFLDKDMIISIEECFNNCDKVTDIEMELFINEIKKLVYLKRDLGEKIKINYNKIRSTNGCDKFEENFKEKWNKSHEEEKNKYESLFDIQTKNIVENDNIVIKKTEKSNTFNFLKFVKDSTVKNQNLKTRNINDNKIITEEYTEVVSKEGEVGILKIYSDRKSSKDFQVVSEFFIASFQQLEDYDFYSICDKLDRKIEIKDLIKYERESMQTPSLESFENVILGFSPSSFKKSENYENLLRNCAELFINKLKDSLSGIEKVTLTVTDDKSTHIEIIDPVTNEKKEILIPEDKQGKVGETFEYDQLISYKDKTNKEIYEILLNDSNWETKNIGDLIDAFKNEKREILELNYENAMRIKNIYNQLILEKDRLTKLPQSESTIENLKNLEEDLKYYDRYLNQLIRDYTNQLTRYDNSMRNWRGNQAGKVRPILSILSGYLGQTTTKESKSDLFQQHNLNPENPDPTRNDLVKTGEGEPVIYENTPKKNENLPMVWGYTGGYKRNGRNHDLANYDNRNGALTANWFEVNGFKSENNWDLNQELKIDLSMGWRIDELVENYYSTDSDKLRSFIGPGVVDENDNAFDRILKSYFLDKRIKQAKQEIKNRILNF